MKKICEVCGFEQDINEKICKECGNEFKIPVKIVKDAKYGKLKKFGIKNPYEKDTSKIPSLRQQESDISNPDLDKRFEPERSCHNCIYGEEEEWTDTLKCEKHNYMVLDGGITDSSWYYAICDEYFTKEEEQRDKRIDEFNKDWKKNYKPPVKQVKPSVKLPKKNKHIGRKVLAILIIGLVIGVFSGYMNDLENQNDVIKSPLYFENEVVSSNDYFRYEFPYEQSNQTMYNFSINIQYNESIRKINDIYYGGLIIFDCQGSWYGFQNDINNDFNYNLTNYDFKFSIHISDNRYSQIVNITILWICLNITYYDWDMINNP